jgi:hypothetical protein
MRGTAKKRDERGVCAVSRIVKLTLAGAIVLHVACQTVTSPPAAHASALREPPAVEWLRVASVGEPIALAQLLTLYVQAFDNQPGMSVPFARLDYATLTSWLGAVLELDPAAQYPLMLASHVYAPVLDRAKQRQMLDFVHREFLRDPDRRWRWLAHAAIVAKHRLQDMPLALAYAQDIARHAKGAVSWARQMRIFILEDMGENEAAAVLLGGLLESGEVIDANELRFLAGRLDALRAVTQ